MPHTRFTKEFQDEAVRLALTSGRSPSERADHGHDRPVQAICRAFTTLLWSPPGFPLVDSHPA